MSEYQLELKQIVDYPRCRIYREFVHLLIKDRNIRTGGSSGLFHYTVLCSYANFRTSYYRLGGIRYTVFPGEWLFKVEELKDLFRVRTGRQVVDILINLEMRHLVTFTILGHGTIIKYKITDWSRHNRVLEYNAPCQKDTGFFFMPICVASEIIGYARPSEMDIILDLWLNTVYHDERVEGSMIGPVVYMRTGSGKALVSYEYLGERWNLSKATVGRYLKKLQKHGYITLTTFLGTRGSIIYINKYLSTMFRISDVLLDKEEIAMALNIKINLGDSVSIPSQSVSKPNMDKIIRKVENILSAQGFPCFSCRRLQYKLLRLSDCREDLTVADDGPLVILHQYRLSLLCNEKSPLAEFDLIIRVARKNGGE